VEKVSQKEQKIFLAARIHYFILLYPQLTLKTISFLVLLPMYSCI